MHVLPAHRLQPLQFNPSPLAAPPVERLAATSKQARPDALENLGGAVQLLWRASALACIFAPLLLASPLALISESARQALIRLLVRTLVRAGPCAIKLGQWASTRPDILPLSVCVALSQLHESVPILHSFQDTRRACAVAFGVGWESHFRALGEVPIGSGCIAQVHRGELLDGTPVAVKVLHPDAVRTCQLDLSLIRIAVDLVERFAPIRGLRWLSLRGASEQFEAFMLMQLDLTIEAANLRTFARNFAAQPVSFSRSEACRISFPAPIERLVSGGVLVETWIEGRSLSALLQPPGDELACALDETSKKRLARAGLRAFLQMLLVHNFVHADLHPGNILCVLPPPAPRAGAPEPMLLVFIDAGLTVELSHRDRRNFLRLFEAIVHGDGWRAGTLMLENAREADCPDSEGFKAKIEGLVQQSHAARRGDFTLSRIDVGRILLDVLTAVRTHRVMIDSNFTTLVSSIALLEGLGRQLDPDLDLLTLAVPLLARRVVTEAVLNFRS